jgi:hypothetical protein
MEQGCSFVDKPKRQPRDDTAEVAATVVARTPVPSHEVSIFSNTGVTPRPPSFLPAAVFNSLSPCCAQASGQVLMGDGAASHGILPKMHSGARPVRLALTPIDQSIGERETAPSGS